jgi:hypothetical protein
MFVFAIIVNVKNGVSVVIVVECPFADIETYSNFEKKLCSRGNKLK